MLRNESVTIEGLTFIGLDDFWTPRFDPRQVLFDNVDVPAAITLCHNPDAADVPVWHNHRGWILSGHTHGGQCKPPFLPPPLLPVRNLRYTRGTFDVGSGRMMYISAGVGHLLKARFNVRPEIPVFTLARV
jgi:predicted MPP superfamily phosphohydrolase